MASTAIETILEYLKTAKTKESDGKKLFIVDRHAYYTIAELLHGEVDYTQRFVKSDGLEAFEFSVGALDERNYYVGTQADQILDKLFAQLKKA